MAVAARLLKAVFDEPDNEIRQLRQYLKKGYPLNAKEAQEPHRTLLHIVGKLKSEQEQRDITRALIKGGARLNAKTSEGVTPLMQCAMIGTSCVVPTLLMEAGANVHAVCNGLFTALHHAAANCRSTALPKLLLASGASAAAVCRLGGTALHYACMTGSPEVSTPSS
jgi:ankyrin repeat protein